MDGLSGSQGRQFGVVETDSGLRQRLQRLRQPVAGRLGGRFDPPVAFEPVLGLLGEINPFDEQRQVRPLVAPGQLQVLFDRVRLQRGVGAAAATRLCTV